MEGTNKGQFSVGHPKMGGIKKGQKKRTTEMVHRIFDIVEDDFYNEETGRSQFRDDIANMTAKDRRDVYLKLLKTIMPTVASIAIEDNKTVSTIRQLMENVSAYRKEHQ